MTILVLPQRNLIILAKQISTLHALSGERAILGVAADWLKENSSYLEKEADGTCAEVTWMIPSE